MKFTSRILEQKEILDKLCDMMRPYIEKESLEMETTVQGEREKNNLKIMVIIKYMIDNRLNNALLVKNNNCSFCNPKTMCDKHKSEHRRIVAELGDALLVSGDEVKG